MFRIFGWSCVCGRGQTTFLVLYFRGSQISRFLRQKSREIKDLRIQIFGKVKHDQHCLQS